MDEQKKSLIFDLIWFAFIALWFSLFALMSADPHHDGVMFKAALDVSNGKMLFRDTFGQYGPFTPLFQGAALMMFGRELVVIKLQTVLFYALSAVVFRHFLDLFLRPAFRNIALGFFLLFPPFYVVPMHPWSSVYALFFSLIAGYFMIRLTDNAAPHRKYAAIVGIAAFFAFGCRHPCGLTTLAAGIIVLGAMAYFRQDKWRKFSTELISMLGGFLLPLLLLLLWLWGSGALHDYFIQCFSFIARFGWERGGGGNLWQLFITFFPYDSTFVLFPLAGLLIFYLSLRQMFLKSGDLRLNLKYFAAAVFAMSCYHQYYPVPCIRHLYWAAIPLFGIFALLLQQVFDQPWRKIFRFILLGLLMVYPAIEGGMRLYALYWKLDSLPRRQFMNDIPGLRGMLFLKGEVYYYRRMKAMFDLIPPDIKQRRFVNHTPDGLLNIFFFDQENFHPMFVNWGNDVYPDYTEKLDEFVRQL